MQSLDNASVHVEACEAALLCKHEADKDRRLKCQLKGAITPCAAIGTQCSQGTHSCQVERIHSEKLCV